MSCLCRPGSPGQHDTGDRVCRSTSSFAAPPSFRPDPNAWLGLPRNTCDRWVDPGWPGGTGSVGSRARDSHRAIDRGCGQPRAPNERVREGQAFGPLGSRVDRIGTVWGQGVVHASLSVPLRPSLIPPLPGGTSSEPPIHVIGPPPLVPHGSETQPHTMCTP